MGVVFCETRINREASGPTSTWSSTGMDSRSCWPHSARIDRGEGVECQFFHQRRKYLFLGDYKYWIMVECSDIDLDAEDEVLNRARLYRDRRDFVIQGGDTGKREDYPANPAHSTSSRASDREPERR